MLYLVATPIGNMQDITLRALETLRNVDFVASEDTRHTGMLLKRYEISKPQVAFHEHNEARAGSRILQLLEEGKNVALVTDAGTPGIADPGYTIIQRALAAGCEFTMIPGPTGLIMAVVLSGLPLHSFTFRGFPPRKSGPRKSFFAVDETSQHTLIYYESPYRLESFIKDAIEVYGDRNAAIANDLTKRFEQMQRGKLSELLVYVKSKTARGEFIIVIEGVEKIERAEKRNKYANMNDDGDLDEDEDDNEIDEELEAEIDDDGSVVDSLVDRVVDVEKE